MAIVQKYKTNYAVQSSNTPLEGVQYYTKAELKKLTKPAKGDDMPTIGTYDDKGNLVSPYPSDWLGIDELPKDEED